MLDLIHQDEYDYYVPWTSKLGSEQGTIDSDKGDHVIEISSPSDEKVNIVIESKAGSNFD